VSRTAIIADVIRTHARQLKMPGLARSFADLARQAREEHWSHEDYLQEVLAVEVASRAESAVTIRERNIGRFDVCARVDGAREGNAAHMHNTLGEGRLAMILAQSRGD